MFYSRFKFYILFAFYIYWNNIWGHVSFRWVSDEACQGLQSDMWVSDGSLLRHVGLRWVFNRSPMGLRLISDNYNIFVNSL